jgi:uncharacterized protein
MITRWQEKQVVERLKYRRVVNLTGARQCGKTTLAGMVALPSSRRFTLDDEKTRNAALDDPMGFVAHTEGETLVLDEIQKAPELLNAIKIQVDRDNSRGQYLLTGSSNLRFVKSVSDSLAGRMGWVRLRTLALGEIMGGRGDFLQRAFNRDFADAPHPLGKRDIIHLASQGGYPEVLEMEAKERRLWFAEYLNDLLMKDIRDVTEIRKLDVLGKIAQWLLAYSSKFFEAKDLAAKAGVSKDTLDSYIATLKTVYLFDEVKPWAKSDYAKIGKRSKFYASDSGLVANMPGWTEEAAYMDDDMSGKLVETWVYQNLASLIDLDLDYEISQYRDSNKREIDFIVERPDGAMLGIEVKSGSAFSPSDFKHLKWFAANLAKKPFTGIVLYAGEHVLRFGEGFYAVPLALLAS